MEVVRRSSGGFDRGSRCGRRRLPRWQSDRRGLWQHPSVGGGLGGDDERSGAASGAPPCPWRPPCGGSADRGSGEAPSSPCPKSHSVDSGSAVAGGRDGGRRHAGAGRRRRCHRPAGPGDQHTGRRGRDGDGDGVGGAVRARLAERGPAAAGPTFGHRPGRSGPAKRDGTGAGQGSSQSESPDQQATPAAVPSAPAATLATAAGRYAVGPAAASPPAIRSAPAHRSPEQKWSASAYGRVCRGGRRGADPCTPQAGTA